jgi:hypothetical protein
MQAPRDRTSEAVRHQAAAMGSGVFEIGLFKPDAMDGEPVMLPRVWDTDALLRSTGWLRNQNREGRNVYIRPKGEHDLSLVDDLSRDAIRAMKHAGFAPALVVETSPDNFQAWLKHPGQLSKQLGTAAARSLSERFGGDTKAADWRHFGRLAGFTNRKEKYRNPETGLHPFVKLIEAPGAVYPEAERFLADVRKSVEREQQEKQYLRNAVQVAADRLHRESALKSIEAFRSDPRYGGDGTRVDLAYGIYAFSRGASAPQVEAALRSRDLSHKGGERRQRDYVERTIKKALEATNDRGR